ncbi:MAG: hydantoinase B/oxoprolinase family protein [Bradymonadaceae bacterium]
MNPVELEVYRHLFASIAEEMGTVLMRSAFSPNIKERRDFSCAIFDAAGEMVAQAAHIPVHLGSTPMSVRAAMNAVDMTTVDSVILNDPFEGGTHLPDITLVTAVLDDRGEVLFYAANRAHHADVGGISPGSLPLSDTIDDEGIRLGPTPWGEEVEEKIALASRTPDERRGDLRAQVAANRRGSQRLLEIYEQRGSKLIHASRALQDHSERFMSRLIEEIPDGIYGFEDYLDDDGFGNGPLRIACEMHIEGERVRVDFSSSVDQTPGPVNVPRAVTVSAVLYAFRCLAPPELPSNGGYMRCIEVLTRSGSLVDATYPSAVAAGNVETSQRITDVVLGALAKALPGRIPAASCGSMNNVMIGGTDRRSGHEDIEFAYYETIGGGSGAGSDYNGQSGIQTHMTNTLNTPVEALEHAYPFRIETYALRRGSGGKGRHRGGDGIIRVYVFDAPATVTLMTERRLRSPYGLCGGTMGERGRNVLVRDGVEKELAPKWTGELQAGDRLRIETPGGGGYGTEGEPTS